MATVEPARPQDAADPHAPQGPETRGERPLQEDDVVRTMAALERARQEIARVIVGHADAVEAMLVAVLAGGHVLLEGVPGLGKTLMVRTVADVLGLRFRRVQFTPDLMPADITGTHVLVESEDGGRRFEFRPGPLFAQVVLADEINRATPKTQSALLEAMQEHRVTAAGESHRLPEPFFVLATQNPIEMEGTYPLPEAQLDRFLFKLLLSPPGEAELAEIIDRTTGRSVPSAGAVLDAEGVLTAQALVRGLPMASLVRDYVIRLVMGTHPHEARAPELVRRYVRFGVSPRGAQALVLAAKARAFLHGRLYVTGDDVRAVAGPALVHRILLHFDAEASSVSPDQVIAQVVAATPEPGGPS